MTNRYEDALDDMPENDGAEDPFHWVCDNYETIRSALKLAQDAEQLRKERDEFATAIIKIHEDQEGDYDFLKFISHPQYILAKKVAGE